VRTLGKLQRPEAVRLQGRSKNTDVVLYRRILAHARPCWPHIVLLFLLSLLSAPLALLTPLPLKLVVDCVLGSQPLPSFLSGIVPQSLTATPMALLWFTAGFVVAVALLTQLQAMATSVLRTYTAERLVQDFRARLFERVQRLSFVFHDKRGASDAAYRIQQDANAVQYVAIDGVIPFIASTVTFVSMLYVIAKLDWQLCVVALAVSPALFVLARSYRTSLRRRAHQAKRLESNALAVIYEVLSALRVVKAFGQEEREQTRFVETARLGMRERIQLAVSQGGLGLLVGITIAAGTASTLFLGTRHVLSGALLLGELLLIMGYLAQLYDPLKTMSRKIASLQSHLASAERAFALLDEPNDVPESPHAVALSRARGEVCFEQVTFQYEEAQPVLQKVSFTVAPGMRVGIAGRTGAGKSTLLHLLTRFFDPTSGRILLDGTDLRDYKLADLRHQFAIVLQEPVLFSTSIAENIAYARANAQREEIVEAARAANVHDFIEKLPGGFETQVGERGMRLSGGERQRIALARAFLKDAPILLLDEPTSSVDLRTEAGILESLERLMRGRTTFIVAHRMNTLKGCDLLLRFEEDGCVRVLESAASLRQEGLAQAQGERP
jgi:ATP-binding cassette subfamily B protein